MEDKYRYVVTARPDNPELELLPFMRYLLSSGNVEWVVLHDLDTNNDADQELFKNPGGIFIFWEQLVAKGGQLIEMNVELYVGVNVYRIMVIDGLDIDILCSDDSILTLPELLQFRKGDISLYNTGY